MARRGMSQEQVAAHDALMVSPAWRVFQPWPAVGTEVLVRGDDFMGYWWARVTVHRRGPANKPMQRPKFRTTDGLILLDRPDRWMPLDDPAHLAYVKVMGQKEGM